MKIRAGLVEEIHWDSGNWIFLDIGFSEKLKTCGLCIGEDAPVNLRFGDMKAKVAASVQTSSRPSNLVIEAPLSVAFTKSGNPTGRAIEVQEGKNPRYWYLQGGAAVMVAAQYLIHHLMNEAVGSEIRLFEGFVSFKPKHEKTDHSKDVELLREVVKNPAVFSTAIITPQQLTRDPSHNLQGAFSIMGVKVGVPPIIKR
jgi:hypothetical protein